MEAKNIFDVEFRKNLVTLVFKQIYTFSANVIKFVHYTYTLYTVLQYGEFELKIKEIDRECQNLMTSDPNKVWPNASLPYLIDQRLGKHACFSSDY